MATAGGGVRGARRGAPVPDPVARPRPGRGLKETAFRGGGVRVVARGRIARSGPDDIEVDGVITVFPEGHTDAADAPTLLIHYRDDQEFTPRPGREDWTVDDLVAYSKLCTHAGCPVGLYQAERACCCARATSRRSTCSTGPGRCSAPRPGRCRSSRSALDDDGYLVATGDFSEPVGPGFWDRGR